MRAFVLLAILLLAGGTAAAQAPTGTQIVLLGTKGGPFPHASRAQPANAVIVNGTTYIVDAGDGIVRQMELGGYSLADVRAVFITHHHSDHVAGYGPLLLRAWNSGHRGPITAWGPSPLEQMTVDYWRHMAPEITARIAALGTPAIETMIEANDIEEDGVVYEDENVRVTAFSVEHVPDGPAYGYRFDTPDMSIVFSGDTRPSENLIEAAKGVDFLVHEVVNPDVVDAILDRASGDKDRVREHLLGNHTTTAQAGEIATRANVKTLVLSHFGGAGYADFDRPEIWEAQVRETWDGNLIVGEDLMVIEYAPE